MSEEKIVVSCPHCNSTMSAPARAVGRRVSCPRCKKEFLVELPDAVFPEHEHASPVPFIRTDKQPATRSGRQKTKGHVAARPSKNMMAVYVAAGFAGVLFLILVIGFIANAEKGSIRDETEEFLGGVLAIPILILMLGFYFLPSIIAFFRGHENSVPIMIVNFFAGWTALGWVASLAWAFSSSVKESRQYIRQVVVHETADDRWRERDP